MLSPSLYMPYCSALRLPKSDKQVSWGGSFLVHRSAVDNKMPCNKQEKPTSVCMMHCKDVKDSSISASKPKCFMYVVFINTMVISTSFRSSFEKNMAV